MDVYFTFDKATRTLSSDRKAYAGQVFDSNSTVLHFRLLDNGEEWNFAEDGNNYVPNIVFDVCDERGFPFVYGLNTSPLFDGYTFEVPFDITSRAKSARISFQLWYISAKYQDTFDGTPNGMLRTEYLLSATAGIAIKPSCVKPPKCGCGDLPYSPALAPGIAGPIEFYREHAVLIPIEATQPLNGSGIDLTVHSLSGQCQTAHLPVATVDLDGHVKIDNLPTGNQAGQIPKLVGPIMKDQALVYGQVETQYGYVNGFVGADLAVALEYVPIEENGNKTNRHLLQLKAPNGKILSTVDLPIENVIKGAEYKVEERAIWFYFENPELDFSIQLDDLVDLYKGTPGEIVISTNGTPTAGVATAYKIGLDPSFKSNVDEHLGDIYDPLAVAPGNPHGMTKRTIGLDDVDNTADRNKPVSVAQEARVKEAEGKAARELEAARVKLDERITGVEAESRAKDVSQDEEFNILKSDFRVWTTTTDNTLNSIKETAVNNLEEAKSYTNAQLMTKQDKLSAGKGISAEKLALGVVEYNGPSMSVDSVLSSESTNAVQNAVVTKALAKKQDTLIAGENIAISDSGVIRATPPAVTVDNMLSGISENPVMNKVITRALDLKANKGEGVGIWKGAQNENGVGVSEYLYNTGDVVVYDDALYISKVDNNWHHPTDETCWAVVRGGAVSQIVGITPATYIGVFGNETDTEYVLTHGLNSRNLVFSFITNDDRHEYIQARVWSPTLNTIRVKFTSPPGTNRIIVNIIKARTVNPSASQDFPLVVNVDTPAKTWTYSNETGLPLYAKAFDETGNDINGDIIQNSGTEFDPITVSFAEAQKGTLFLASTTADLVYEVELDGTHPYEITGLTNDKGYVVQCFKDGEGQSRLDVHQEAGKVTIDANQAWKGFVALYPATGVKKFTKADLKSVTHDGSPSYELTYQHNKGRAVGGQYYNAEGLGIVDMHVEPNVIKLYFNSEEEGTLYIV